MKFWSNTTEIDLIISLVSCHLQLDHTFTAPPCLSSLSKVRRAFSLIRVETQRPRSSMRGAVKAWDLLLGGTELWIPALVFSWAATGNDVLSLIGLKPGTLITVDIQDVEVIAWGRNWEPFNPFEKHWLYAIYLWLWQIASRGWWKHKPQVSPLSPSLLIIAICPPHFTEFPGTGSCLLCDVLTRSAQTTAKPRTVVCGILPNGLLIGELISFQEWGAGLFGFSVLRFKSSEYGARSLWLWFKSSVW